MRFGYIHNNYDLVHLIEIVFNNELFTKTSCYEIEYNFKDTTVGLVVYKLDFVFKK